MKKHLAIVLFSLLASSTAYAGKPVNINTASAEEIAESLDGIGLKKAQAIVDYRTQVGSYKTADELSNVKGIGEKTIERNREFVVLTREAPKKTAQVNQAK